MNELEIYRTLTAMLVAMNVPPAVAAAWVHTEFATFGVPELDWQWLQTLDRLQAQAKV